MSAKKLYTAMAIWITRTVGALLIGLGFLGMLTPIPFGLFCFIAGLLFLIPTVPAAARPVRFARRKLTAFDRVMHAATKRLPVPYRRILRETEI